MKFKKSKGLTLLEVIISLAILGIIIAPILSVTLTSVKVSKSSEDKIFATSLAQQCTEYLKNKIILNDDVLGDLKSDVGLEKIDNLNADAIDNLADIKAIFSDEELKKCHIYSGENRNKYRNIITEIEYTSESASPISEYNDIKDNDILIVVSSRDGTKSSSTLTLYESEKNAYIKIKRNDDKLTYVVMQGNTKLCEKEVSNPKYDSGSVKLILKGTKIINFNIEAENGIPNNVFNIDFIKEINSRYTYSMLTDGNSNIKMNYKTFDASSNDPNKLVRKNTFKINVWNCDFKNKTKNLLQKIETTKVM